MQFHQFLYPADIRKRLGANFLTAVCPTSFTHDQLPSLIDEHGYNDFTCDDLFRHKDGKACVLGCMSKVINPLFCLRKGADRGVGQAPGPPTRINLSGTTPEAYHTVNAILCNWIEPDPSCSRAEAEVIKGMFQAMRRKLKPHVSIMGPGILPTSDNLGSKGVGRKGPRCEWYTDLQGILVYAKHVYGHSAGVTCEIHPEMLVKKDMGALENRLIHGTSTHRRGIQAHSRDKAQMAIKNSLEELSKRRFQQLLLLEPFCEDAPILSSLPQPLSALGFDHPSLLRQGTGVLLKTTFSFASRFVGSESDIAKEELIEQLDSLVSIEMCNRLSILVNSHAHLLVSLTESELAYADVFIGKLVAFIGALLSVVQPAEGLDFFAAVQLLLNAARSVSAAIYQNQPPESPTDKLSRKAVHINYLRLKAQQTASAQFEAGSGSLFMVSALPTAAPSKGLDLRGGLRGCEVEQLAEEGMDDLHEGDREDGGSSEDDAPPAPCQRKRAMSPILDLRRDPLQAEIDAGATDHASPRAKVRKVMRTTGQLAAERLLLQQGSRPPPSQPPRHTTQPPLRSSSVSAVPTGPLSRLPQSGKVYVVAESSDDEEITCTEAPVLPILNAAVATALEVHSLNPPRGESGLARVQLRSFSANLPVQGCPTVSTSNPAQAAPILQPNPPRGESGLARVRVSSISGNLPVHGSPSATTSNPAHSASSLQVGNPQVRVVPEGLQGSLIPAEAADNVRPTGTISNPGQSAPPQQAVNPPAPVRIVPLCLQGLPVSLKAADIGRSTVPTFNPALSAPIQRVANLLGEECVGMEVLRVPHISAKASDHGSPPVSISHQALSAPTLQGNCLDPFQRSLGSGGAVLSETLATLASIASFPPVHPTSQQASKRSELKAISNQHLTIFGLFDVVSPARLCVQELLLSIKSAVARGPTFFETLLGSLSSESHPVFVHLSESKLAGCSPEVVENGKGLIEFFGKTAILAKGLLVQDNPVIVNCLREGFDKHVRLMESQLKGWYKPAAAKRLLLAPNGPNPQLGMAGPSGSRKQVAVPKPKLSSTTYMRISGHPVTADSVSQHVSKVQMLGKATQQTAQRCVTHIGGVNEGGSDLGPGIDGGVVAEGGNGSHSRTSSMASHHAPPPPVLSTDPPELQALHQLIALSPSKSRSQNPTAVSPPTAPALPTLPTIPSPNPPPFSSLNCNQFTDAASSPFPQACVTNDQSILPGLAVAGPALRDHVGVPGGQLDTDPPALVTPAILQATVFDKPPPHSVAVDVFPFPLNSSSSCEAADGSVRGIATPGALSPTHELPFSLEPPVPALPKQLSDAGVGASPLLNTQDTQDTLLTSTPLVQPCLLSAPPLGVCVGGGGGSSVPGTVTGTRSGPTLPTNSRVPVVWSSVLTGGPLAPVDPSSRPVSPALVNPALVNPDLRVSGGYGQVAPIPPRFAGRIGASPGQVPGVSGSSSSGNQGTGHYSRPKSVTESMKARLGPFTGQVQASFPKVGISPVQGGGRVRPQPATTASSAPATAFLLPIPASSGRDFLHTPLAYAHPRNPLPGGAPIDVLHHVPQPLSQDPVSSFPQTLLTQGSLTSVAAGSAGISLPSPTLEQTLAGYPLFTPPAVFQHFQHGALSAPVSDVSNVSNVLSSEGGPRREPGSPLGSLRHQPCDGAPEHADVSSPDVPFDPDNHQCMICYGQWYTHEAVCCKPKSNPESAKVLCLECIGRLYAELTLNVNRGFLQCPFCKQTLDVERKPQGPKEYPISLE